MGVEGEARELEEAQEGEVVGHDSSYDIRSPVAFAASS